MNEKRVMYTMKGVKVFLYNICICKLETYSKITNFLKSNKSFLLLSSNRIVLYKQLILFNLKNYSLVFTRNGKRNTGQEDLPGFSYDI